MVKIEDFYKIYKSSQGVSIDSRTIKSAQIFFAIKGEYFDGHDYISQLIDKGIHYFIIDNPDYYIDDRTYLVDNALDYLQDLARYHRAQFDIPVLAITGSNGKTTTKELLSVCLSNSYKLHATKGNFNNHLGVPLTILEAKEDVDFMIIEMGANHIGEIKLLCEIACPTHGLITNIGKAHIEGFGSVEGIIQGKTELYQFLRLNKGVIFYNKDDIILSNQILDEDDTVAYSINQFILIKNSLTLGFKNSEGQLIHTNLYGKFNLMNIIAALKVATYFDVDENLSFKSISDYKPQMNRSQLLEKGTITFIMDAYNANPSSMVSSIVNLKELDVSQPKALILGDMKELGSDELLFHAEIISLIKLNEWKFVALVGTLFEQADSVAEYNHFKDINDLMDYAELKDKLNGAICLIKGSRSMNLEKIIDLF